MNKRKFTTLAAGVAAALLVSALAFTVVSCGGDEFTQEDMDAEFARGQAAVAKGTVDAALVDLYFNAVSSGNVYTIAGTGNGTGNVVKLAADGKLVYGADAAKDFVTITNPAVKNALALLVTDGETFKVGYANIPGLGERAWIDAISSKSATPNLDKLFAATNSVTLSTTTVTEFTGSVPAGANLTATVSVTSATDKKLKAEAGAMVNGVIFPAKTDTIISLAANSVTAGNISVPAGKELVIVAGSKLIVVDGSTVKLTKGTTEAGDAAIRLVGAAAAIQLGTAADLAHPLFINGSADAANTALIAVRPKRVNNAYTTAGAIDTLYANKAVVSVNAASHSNGVTFASNVFSVDGSITAFGFASTSAAATSIESNGNPSAFALTTVASDGLITIAASITP
ncbi:MAG: hypothetical protein Ta2G_14930 [Termitinemataceae bacterium]|nr:MAG: hypothetical protein Ta2G_14930 [Termitinemataceae bacterium]